MCRGAKLDSDFCSYEVVIKKPILVVRDIFADYMGESCRCPQLHEEKIKKCDGYVKRACCARYDGKKTCQCNLPGGKYDYVILTSSQTL